MKKKESDFVCFQCHFCVAKWQGRCPECGEWNTFQPRTEIRKEAKGQSFSLAQSITATQSNTQKVKHLIDWPELERVLGGGLMAGAFTLLAGEPGVGKSTLILEILKRLGADQKVCKNRVLYVSGEESVDQISMRASRVGVEGENLHLMASNDLGLICEEVKKIKANLVIVDSIQTMINPDIEAHAGSITQVKETTQLLLDQFKSNQITCLIIGHIAKDGNIAGPKVLEHMVDTVLYFESGREQTIRVLKAKKNRFGPTGETCFFKMEAGGLKDFTWKEELEALNASEEEVGLSYGVSLGGSRPLLFDVQTLVVKSGQIGGKRIAEGFENARLNLLIAVLEKVHKISFLDFDIYLRVGGQAKKPGREIDLAVCASLLSSFKECRFEILPLLHGEVTLTGKVRSDPLLTPQRMASLYELDHLLGLRDLISS